MLSRMSILKLASWFNDIYIYIYIYIHTHIFILETVHHTEIPISMSVKYSTMVPRMRSWNTCETTSYRTQDVFLFNNKMHHPKWHQCNVTAKFTEIVLILNYHMYLFLHYNLLKVSHTVCDLPIISANQYIVRTLLDISSRCTFKRCNFLTVLTILFTHLVIIQASMMIMYHKLNCGNIVWKYKWLSQDFCRNITVAISNIEIYIVYRDIGWICSRP